MKKVVVSCGPIPARLDSVKFITNRFKGGLAFKTARYLYNKGFDVTVVKWKHADTPFDPNSAWLDGVTVVDVEDVNGYYQWFTDHAKDYDAFVMAAAVANLMPSEPYEGKFPSHLYKPGQEFDIKFAIAPRAIDAIKRLNPRACLIGYKLFDAETDEELVEIARRTRQESHANIIFANTPAEAKTRKLAVFADNTVINCDFDEHLKLIARAINQEYYSTMMSSLKYHELLKSPDGARLRHAETIVKMFDRTFHGFGTVAVPCNGNGGFVTTCRGHNGDPVYVSGVDHDARTVYANGRATLNAPLLASIVAAAGPNHIVVHRHEDDPLYDKSNQFDAVMDEYLFPGTAEETLKFDAKASVASVMRNKVRARYKLYKHGDISILPIQDIDWDDYHDVFPNKYFSIPGRMQAVIDSYRNLVSLEIGANQESSATYAYDPYVETRNAVNLDWLGVMFHRFDLVYAKNAINYFSIEQLKIILERTDAFIANTFEWPPAEKVCDNEAAIHDYKSKLIHHALRLPDDSIVTHQFHAYTPEDYAALGLEVYRYGSNSCIVCKLPKELDEYGLD